MTIDLTDNAPRVSYTVSQGNTQTSFTVPFEFFDNTDLKVVVDGTLKTITTHYSVSGGNGSTGTVTMSVTGATGGSTVIIYREIPLTRTTDFPTSGAFPIATLNTELDRTVALFDDRKDRIDRSVRLNDNDDAASMVLPLKASRVGTVLGFNATTGAAEAGPTIANVNSLADITTNINTVAGISSNVTTVAGISSNVTTVAGISSAVSSVAGVASLITSDFVSDLNTLATSAIVEDLNILATTDIVSDLNQLATSDFVSDLNAIEAIKANVTSVGNNIANVNTVATQLTSSSPTFTNTVTASAYTTSGGGTFFIGNTSFRQTGVTRTDGEIELDSSSTIKLRTNSGEVNLFDDDSYFGRISQDGNGELVISSGSSGGGGAPVTALTFSGANATFSGTINTTSTNKIQFGDSGTYIHQSADGVLDLVSDSEIEINATTIDMNGNLDVSGSATIGTDVTSASGNFITTGSDIALKHSSGENFFTATKDGSSGIYHDAYPVFSTTATNAGAVGTTNKNTQTLDTQSTFLEIGGSGIAGGTDTGTVVLSATSNANDERIGDIRFANAENADDDGTDADGRMVARIQSKSVTSDSNAGDDSGGTIVFSTKPEAGSIATALTLGSDQSATFGGNVDVTGTVTADGLTVDGNAQINGDITVFDGTGDPFIKLQTNEQQTVLRIDNDASDIFQIRDTTNAANRLAISTGGDISFYEDTGTTPKFFFDASEESLVIGASSTATVFEATGSKNDQWAGKFTNTNSGGYGVLAVTAGSTANEKAFEVRKNTSDTALLIQGDGNVGIGCIPDSTVSLDVQNLSASSNNVFLRLRNTTSLEDTGIIIDGNNGGQREYKIGVNTIANSSDLTFSGPTGYRYYIGSSQVVTVDSSGNLLVGKTSASGSTAGAEFRADGRAIVVVDDNYAGFFARRSTDGEILRFLKDTTTVGRISSTSTGVALGTPTGSGSGLHLISNAILPSTSTGGTADGLKDLGSSSSRFKDFYLSSRVTNDGTGGVSVDTGGDVEIIQEGTGRLKSVGGVFLGGTASANLLDDYEEGSWTPLVRGSSTAGTASYSTQAGRYTKIGNLIHVNFILEYSISSAAGNLEVTGFPFAGSGNEPNDVGVLQHNQAGASYASGVASYVPYMSSNVMSFRGNKSDGTSYANLAIQNMSYMRVTFVYTQG